MALGLALILLIKEGLRAIGSTLRWSSDGQEPAVFSDHCYGGNSVAHDLWMVFQTWQKDGGN